MSVAPPPRSWLDRPSARAVALLVAAVAGAILGYLHRGDLFPTAHKVSPEEVAFKQCIGPRLADIDEMVRQKVITADQETLFRERAEALCRAQTAPAGAPPPPGLPLPQQ
jgi:hypothetical protein